METHRVETTVHPHGTIHLEDLPLKDGEEVEVVIQRITKASPKKSKDPYPLRGSTPYSYEDPFSPMISLEDWKPEK